MSDVVVRLTEAEAKALGDPFADPFRLRKQFETGRAKLRAALDSPPVEREEFRVFADLITRMEVRSTLARAERLREDIKAAGAPIHRRTITTFSDGSQLISRWEDFDVS